MERNGHIGRARLREQRAERHAADDARVGTQVGNHGAFAQQLLVLRHELRAIGARERLEFFAHPQLRRHHSESVGRQLDDAQRLAAAHVERQRGQRVVAQRQRVQFAQAAEQAQRQLDQVVLVSDQLLEVDEQAHHGRQSSQRVAGQVEHAHRVRHRRPVDEREVRVCQVHAAQLEPVVRCGIGRGGKREAPHSLRGQRDSDGGHLRDPLSEVVV